jgi:general secretion pathway protein K
MTRSISPRETGAALLTVLIVVGVIGAIAAVTFDQLRLATMLATNNTSLEQARGIAMAAETLATARIDALVAVSPLRTTLAGGWQGRATVVPLPTGSARLIVRDGGNCFNLNSLVVLSAGKALASRPLAIDQFVQLMTGLGIPAGQARRVAASAADWIDSDQVPNTGGAEDSTYLRRTPAYRTGDTLMAEASELRAVNGVTPAIYDRLQPWLCALPLAEMSPININTLTTEQAPLLAMLVPTVMSDATARRILAQRPGGGWPSVTAFWNTPLLRDYEPEGDVLRQPQVRTTWFTLDLAITAGDAELRQSSLIDARRTPVSLASRRWTEAE